MKTSEKVEEYKEAMSRLTRVAKHRECGRFAGLCWDKVDPFALEENPGVLFETKSRVFVFQEINGEIRYYAGGWGIQEDIETGQNEFGTFKDFEDALAFAVAFFVDAALSIKSRRPETSWEARR
jgi:hypothetical protein